VQHASKLKPVDEDARAQELWQAGFRAEVVKPRNKSGLWTLKRPFDLVKLNSLLEASGSQSDYSGIDWAEEEEE
jgi:hypothetical protein